MARLFALFDPYAQPEPPPAPSVITENVSGGLAGLQPTPAGATDSQGDGTVDVTQLLACVNRAPDVQRSYAETAEQAYSGVQIDNYGYNGTGAPLPDQTLGANRWGYRGGADEPLPERPPTPDCGDGDYDGDTPRA